MLNLNFCHFRICLNDCTCLHSWSCTSPHERPAGNFKNVFITGGQFIASVVDSMFSSDKTLPRNQQKATPIVGSPSFKRLYNCICTYWTHIYKSDNMQQDVFATTLKQACLQFVTILFFFEVARRLLFATYLLAVELQDNNNFLKRLVASLFTSTTLW